eukprot:901986-Alexandrium_andersonii.AAC.1
MPYGLLICNCTGQKHPHACPHTIRTPGSRISIVTDVPTYFAGHPNSVVAPPPPWEAHRQVEDRIATRQTASRARSKCGSAHGDKIPRGNS